MNYVAPRTFIIGERTRRALCLSGNGTEGVGVSSNTYGDDDFDTED